MASFSVAFMCLLRQRNKRVPGQAMGECTMTKR